MKALSEGPVRSDRPDRRRVRLARPARAQGCIIIRNNEPLFGKGQPALLPKEWQFYMQYRDLTRRPPLQRHGSTGAARGAAHNVINRQRISTERHLLVTPRLGLAFSVPLVDASWSIPLPVQPVPGTRRKQSASGLGDISPRPVTGCSTRGSTARATGRRDSDQGADRDYRGRRLSRLSGGTSATRVDSRSNRGAGWASW